MKKKKTRVVVIGGGTGLSTLVRGLKLYPFDITAIVTVADDGGSSGRLRDDYDIPPPGDVRNVIAALSDVEPLIEKMFQYRFASKDDLNGHSLGNLMLTALTDITGDFNHAIAEMSKVFKVHGKVIPASNKKVTLHAELKDGTVISGESKIPSGQAPIERVYLEPRNVKPLPAAIHAIERADYILIGPGSLYTSIIPNLLVKGIGDALLRAKGEKIYISNLMTQKGETIDYTASQHVEALHAHIGQPFIETIVINDSELPSAVKENYKEENAEPVKFDIERLHELGLQIIPKNIAMIQDGTVRHQAVNVAQWLNEYVCEKVEIEM
ncbi:MAG: YvcK family protein [Solibacillus sp.]